MREVGSLAFSCFHWLILYSALCQPLGDSVGTRQTHPSLPGLDKLIVITACAGWGGKGQGFHRVYRANSHWGLQRTSGKVHYLRWHFKSAKFWWGQEEYCWPEPGRSEHQRVLWPREAQAEQWGQRGRWWACSGLIKGGGSLKDFQERSSLLQCASLKGSLCRGLEWVGCRGRLKIEGFYIHNYDWFDVQQTITTL